MSSEKESSDFEEETELISLIKRLGSIIDRMEERIFIKANRTRKEVYLERNPDCPKLHDGDEIYPRDPDSKAGMCLCARTVGYANSCDMGEGMCDCRDCWNTIYDGLHK